ncbi:autotransporter domain-containing protein [Psittacicella hinzii]|uniref:Autotransporter domain-containing protein n=1 Tax=Psittacicella hinzii TaxID=2028575 RepID=A0A3A1YLC7_9GAMM|nr:autotransporter domain-containing protein [Psittacicella hinzii]RIY36817.1 hypothetical protein CKF58_05590 [Psittacicella hinzii]
MEQGVASSATKADWHEKLRTTKVYYAKAKVKSQGLILSLGKVWSDTWLSASLYSYNHKFTVDRSSLTVYDQTTEFNGHSYGLSVQAGIKLWQTSNAGLELHGGLTAQIYQQRAFAEQSSSSSASILSIATVSKNHYDAYANLGIKVWYNFKTFSFDSGLDLALNFQQSLSQNRFQVATSTQDLANGFNQDFLAELFLGYRINLTDKLTIKLSTNVTKANAYINVCGKLSLNYAF